MLQIKNLKSGYNGQEILHGIDLEVRPAEIVAIIGPNGSGKSTLLRSIFNLCEIYSGKIIFKDKDITKTHTYELQFISGRFCDILVFEDNFTRINLA